MRNDLFWIAGPWDGRLAIMPRPRGGDWLEEEIQGWRRSGVQIVVSLLTHDEQAEFELADEGNLCRTNGIDFVSFPIVDRSIPESWDAFSNLTAALAGKLAGGNNVAIHCRQGIGRAGMIAICQLIVSGVDEEEAIARVATARGCPVPETPDQRRWVSKFAKAIAAQIPK